MKSIEEKVEIVKEEMTKRGYELVEIADVYVDKNLNWNGSMQYATLLGKNSNGENVYHVAKNGDEDNNNE